jgi:hypothetical protein
MVHIKIGVIIYLLDLRCRALFCTIHLLANYFLKDALRRGSHLYAFFIERFLDCLRDFAFDSKFPFKTGHQSYLRALRQQIQRTTSTEQ